jgi:hypothetical protein
VPRPPDGWPDAGGSAGGAGGLGRDPAGPVVLVAGGLVADGRCLAAVPDHPADGQAEAPLDDPLPPEPGLGGRSSGGAVRLAAPWPLAMALPRTGAAVLASLREPGLGAPSWSAAGGASGRNRDA